MRSSVNRTAAADLCPTTTSREIRLRISSGKSTVVVARKSCAEKPISALCNRRSTPEGSNPKISTTTPCACPAVIRTAEISIPCAAARTGKRPTGLLRLMATSTDPWRSKSRTNRSRPGQSSGEASQCVSKSPKESNWPCQLRFGNQAFGSAALIARAASEAAENTRSFCGAVSCKNATGRPWLPDCCTTSRAASCCASQSLASAQLPSRTTSSFDKFCPLGAGFTIGPARPIIKQAITKARNSKSHHGVLSACTVSSFNPKSRATPGKTRRIGAGGTARSKIHNSGKAKSPTSNQGAVKPIMEKNVIGGIPKRDKDPIGRRLRVDLYCA